MKKTPVVNIPVSHGNSYIKTAVYINGEQKGFFRLESKKMPSTETYLSKLTEFFDYNNFFSKNTSNISTPPVIALCSTKKNTDRFYKKICRETGFKLFNITCESKLPVKLNYDTPLTLGPDRICAAAAAYHKYRMESDTLVVIDFGTATTFNLINKGVFEGGLIAPGFGLYKNSLGNSCDFLYRVRFNRIAGYLCRDTESALIAGIYGGYTALVNGLYSRLLYDARIDARNTCLIITGGYSNFFTTMLDYPVISDPMLVIEGIKLIAGLNGYNT